MLTALLVACMAQEPNFAGVIVTPKMTAQLGSRAVLVICWDPHRPTDPAPEKAVIERLVFGKRPSVAGWFSENSGGRFWLRRAGVLGWYSSKKPAAHYWGPPMRAIRTGMVS